jgi:non-ribosomal peptide synthetase component E (peptide arylation enzyme)
VEKTGNQSLLAQLTYTGGKVVLMHKWNIDDAVRLIRKHKLTAAGGVPSMVFELAESDLKNTGSTLEGFLFGGAPSPENLPASTKRAFPTAVA